MSSSPAFEPDMPVEVRRSRKRRKTVSAYRDTDRYVVLLPGRMSQRDEHHWVATMVRRLQQQERRRRPADDDLQQRARQLSHQYLEARAEPVSVSWVGNQNTRWGSCTPADGTIRLSTRLQGMPAWVIDYVLLHELAHLLVPGHNARFWALLDAYPRTERARGFLDGYATCEQNGGPASEPTSPQTDGFEAEDLDDPDSADQDDVVDLTQAEPHPADATVPAPPMPPSAPPRPRRQRKPIPQDENNLMLELPPA